MVSIWPVSAWWTAPRLCWVSAWRWSLHAALLPGLVLLHPCQSRSCSAALLACTCVHFCLVVDLLAGLKDSEGCVIELARSGSSEMQKLQQLIQRQDLNTKLNSYSTAFEESQKQPWPAGCNNAQIDPLLLFTIDRMRSGDCDSSLACTTLQLTVGVAHQSLGAISSDC